LGYHNDECDSFFDILRSEEECKSQAEEGRAGAAGGMAIGGILTAVGIVSLVVSIHEDNDPDESFSSQRKTLEISED
jgi:hypothetical protein